MITWEDSRQPNGSWQWLSHVGDLLPVKCVTVGWLIKDAADAKVVCQSMADIDCDDMQTGGVMVIPARCVLSIDRLTETGPLKIVTSSSRACGRDAASARKRRAFRLHDETR